MKPFIKIACALSSVLFAACSSQTVGTDEPNLGSDIQDMNIQYSSDASTNKVGEPIYTEQYLDSIFPIQDSLCLLNFPELEEEAIVDTVDNYPPGPPKLMLIVKFSDPSFINRVIVGNQLVVNTPGRDYVYSNDNKLSLYVYDSIRTWRVPMIFNVEGKNPYVHIVDDYYLIDWRWNQKYPIYPCAFAFSAMSMLANHIKKHLYTIDVRWEDFNDHKKTFKYQQCNGRAPISEIGITSYEYIDKFFGRSYNYPDYDFYWNGIYIQGEYNTAEDEERIAKQIVYCDSLQSVFIGLIKELIHNPNTTKALLE